TADRHDADGKDNLSFGLLTAQGRERVVLSQNPQSGSSEAKQSTIGVVRCDPRASTGAGGRSTTRGNTRYDLSNLVGKDAQLRRICDNDRSFGRVADALSRASSTQNRKGRAHGSVRPVDAGQQLGRHGRSPRDTERFEQQSESLHTLDVSCRPARGLRAQQPIWIASDESNVF